MDDTRQPLRYLAIALNALFVLWVLYNGIDEGFQGTSPEKLQYILFILLMVLNCNFLYWGIVTREFCYVVIAGNVIFLLLFAYDFLDRGSTLTGPETTSHIVLVFLFALNAFLLYRRSFE